MSPCTLNFITFQPGFVCKIPSHYGVGSIDGLDSIQGSEDTSLKFLDIWLATVIGVPNCG